MPDTTTNFEQPYRYHAGFGNEGFLYNDAGNLTLAWSSFGPAYEAIVGKWHPWTLTTEQQALLESMLHEAPAGGTWRFANPARCLKCASPISGPITKTINLSYIQAAFIQIPIPRNTGCEITYYPEPHALPARCPCWGSPGCRTWRVPII
jgi:hypothetical protein